MTSILTVDFMRGTGPLVEVPQKKQKCNSLPIQQKRSFRAFEQWKANRTIEFKDLYKSRSWASIMEDKCYNYKYSITVNMDWRCHDDDEEEQKTKMKRILLDHYKYIKNILLVYEYGKLGKMHFHMLVYTTRINDFKKDLQNNFGNPALLNSYNNYAVKVKTIKPNPDVTWEENMDVIKTYLQKDEHNRQRCWIVK